MAQAVERILGKDEVTSSILVSSSKNPTRKRGIFTSSLFTLHSSLKSPPTQPDRGLFAGSGQGTVPCLYKRIGSFLRVQDKEPASVFYLFVSLYAATCL